MGPVRAQGKISEGRAGCAGWDWLRFGGRNVSVLSGAWLAKMIF